MTRAISGTSSSRGARTVNVELNSRPLTPAPATDLEGWPTPHAVDKACVRRTRCETLGFSPARPRIVRVVRGKPVPMQATMWATGPVDARRDTAW